MKKTKIIIAGALIVATTVTVIVCGKFRRHGTKASDTEIEVTEKEISQFREMIGDSMDIKKAVFILFENEEDCKLL